MTDLPPSVPNVDDMTDEQVAAALMQVVEEEKREFAEVERKSTAAFRPIDSTRLTVGFAEMLQQARKPLPWVVRGILLNDTLNIIYGPPKEYKTFIAIDLALSQATGLPFLGKYDVLNKGLVIYVAGEGVAGVGQRVLAWCIERGVDHSKDLPFRRTKGAIQISDGGASLLAEEIEQIVEGSGTPLAGIYIDTLARNFGQGDENSAKDMNVFITQCDQQLKERFNVPVVIVHHSGHKESGRPRGSMALMGAADGLFRVTADFPKVNFKPDWLKDAETPEAHVLEVEKIELGFNDDLGEPVQSIVLRMTNETPKDEKPRLSRDASIALELVDEEGMDFEDWRFRWMEVAKNLPITRGQNKGEKRDQAALRKAWERVVLCHAQNGLLEIERDEKKIAQYVRLARV